MSQDVLIKKLQTELSIYKNPGAYRAYSFLLKMVERTFARSILLEVGYSKTEITRAAWIYHKLNQ